VGPQPECNSARRCPRSDKGGQPSTRGRPRLLGFCQPKLQSQSPICRHSTRVNELQTLSRSIMTETCLRLCRPMLHHLELKLVILPGPSCGGQSTKYQNGCQVEDEDSEAHWRLSWLRAVQCKAVRGLASKRRAGQASLQLLHHNPVTAPSAINGCQDTKVRSQSPYRSRKKRYPQWVPISRHSRTFRWSNVKCLALCISYDVDEQN
jgi:hypothetical protein